tara:strand:- start:585 stop:914 length:330 start_codon:yes stop_codon:yes gene_type:complete
MDFYINNSNIQGKGLFTKKTINPLEILPIANLYNKNNKFQFDKNGTSLGPMGFVNHSYDPNCHLHYVPSENGYFLRAHKIIKPRNELTINYDFNPKGLKKAYQYNPPLK